MTRTALSIAGFDGSGGAGLQADLKTFSALGCYGMTVLTGLPIQNTQGVQYYYDVPLSSIEQQLTSLFDDSKIDVIKIGMLPNASVIKLVASFLKQQATCPIVVDPVMVAKSGHALLKPDAIHSLKEAILPISTMITPNISEAEHLINCSITTPEEMMTAAHELLTLGSKYVLLKGGHLQSNKARDFLTDGKTETWLEADKIHTKNTHGTGCTLSAAIAACLAQGFSIPDAVSKSKSYITQAIKAGAPLSIGKGNGPVHHFYHLWPYLNNIDGKM